MPGYGAVRAPVAVERAVARPSVSLELLPESANSTEEIRPSPAGFASAAVASSAIAVKAPPIASDFPPGFVRLKLTFERSAESVWARAEEGTRAPRRTSSAALAGAPARAGPGEDDAVGAGSEIRHEEGRRGVHGQLDRIPGALIDDRDDPRERQRNELQAPRGKSGGRPGRGGGRPGGGGRRGDGRRRQPPHGAPRRADAGRPP